MSVPRALALPLALALASCVEIAEPTIGGTYRVLVDSPYGNEGGALIELVGPGLGAVSAPGAVVVTHTSGDTLRLLYLNDPQRIASPPPISFSLEVADGTPVPVGRVLQVADPNGRLRDFAGSYVIRYTR